MRGCGHRILYTWGVTEGAPVAAVDDHPHPLPPGEEVDQVFVEIDYAILQHFSKHLYSSPNKAVEELVTNGYDALATRVDVFLDGAWADDCLIIWDNGTSMDVAGLKHLWWIARSPKEDTGSGRVAVSADGKVRRQMVGKFGIGKLASYAVGDRLSHLCRRGGEYLLVSVDYAQAPPLTDDPDRERGFRTPVTRLDQATAERYARSLLRKVPDDWERLLAREHWTMAIVDDVKAGVSLTEGRLGWVLGNGMPLRPDFTVRVNGTPVRPSALSSTLVDWSMATSEVQQQLGSVWKAARDEGTVDGTPQFGDGRAGDLEVHGGGSPATDPALRSAQQAWVDLPSLGRVSARLRLFETSLRDGRAGQHGRSEGFFVYVKGRLLNPDDAKLLLPDPSYGTFNRLQVTIWADGLDEDLLADRERLQRATPTSQALAVLQRSLYLAARSHLDKHDDAQREANSPITALPSESREFFRQPLTALAARGQQGDGPVFNPSKVTLDNEAAQEGDPLMRVDAGSNRLLLNTTHPLFAAVRRKVGDTQKGREALRLVELLAMSDVLLEGHLLDIGVDDDTVATVVEWRSAQLRSIAVRYDNEPAKVVSEALDASYPGGARFERALVTLFRLMGFVATRDAAPGQKDVLVVAPIGESELRFTVEAKGSKSKVANDSAEISGASAHAKAVGARFALVVAREFVGFEGHGDPTTAAVLQECRTQQPPVAIVTVAGLQALYEALQVNHYPLTSMVSVLSEIQTPADKLASIQALKRPVEMFDLRGLLDVVWDLQQGAGSGLPVGLFQVRSARPAWKAMEKEDFDRIVFALEAASGGLLTYASHTYSMTLLQHPDIVAHAIEASLAAPPTPDT
jgi:hypothetical protein